MAKKLSVSIPGDLADELRAAVPGDVSAFVAAARDALDRGRLAGLVAELEDELGPADEDEAAEISAMFARVAAHRQGRTPRPGSPAAASQPAPLGPATRLRS